MKIAIASGKGGTGKTTISTNLALFLSEGSDKVVYLDCDVEEPNGHLFLNPVISEKISSSIPVPVFAESEMALDLKTLWNKVSQKVREPL